MLMQTRTPMRTEHDSLGEIQVPKDALYGAQTMRAVHNYPISGRRAHPQLIRSYVRVKRAAAVVNAKAGVLKKDLAQLIVKACDQLLAMPESDWHKHFVVDPYQAGAGTSQNMNTNEVIANLANLLKGKKPGTYKPVHPNDHVNCSQSTNDSFPTAMRLAVLDASGPLIIELKKLAQSFSSKAKAWEDIPKSARTHLQDAVPMTLGQEFGAYAGTLKKSVKWVTQGRKALRELGIGGSAAGTGINVPRNYPKNMVQELSKLTGESLVLAEDLCESMQSQAPLSIYSSMLRLTTLELTRICNDLRMMVSGPSTGFSEIHMPAVQPGSSIMPGKVNPSIIEMCNQTWYSVLGMDQTIALCVQAGQLELNVMMPMMSYTATEATVVTTHALDIMRRFCIDGLKPNEKRLRHYFESTPQIATALNPILGYENVAKIVKEAVATERSVMELVRERKLVDEKQLSKILDIRKLTGRSK